MNAPAGRSWLSRAALLLVALALIDLAPTLPGAATRQSVGFASYYTAARLVLERRSIAPAYDDRWFERELQRFAPDVHDIFRPNPPSAALLALPVAALPYKAARVAWTLGSLLTATLFWFWAARRLRLFGAAIPLSIAFLLAFDPLRACLWYGQAYLFLLGALTIAARGKEGNEPSGDPGAGIAFGLLVGLKSASGLAPMVLLRPQRRARGSLRAVAWLVGTLLVIALAGGVLAGWDAWGAYLHALRTPGLVFDRPEAAVSAYQSWPSFAQHLTTFDARWNPKPWIDAPAVGRALSSLGSLLLLGMSLWACLRAREYGPAMAALVLASLAASPWTLDYHLALALVPMVLLAESMRSTAGRGEWLALAIGAALLTVPATIYTQPLLQADGRALLAYPKLYGTLVLWALAILRSFASDAAAETLAVASSD